MATTIARRGKLLTEIHELATWLHDHVIDVGGWKEGVEDHLEELDAVLTSTRDYLFDAKNASEFFKSDDPLAKDLYAREKKQGRPVKRGVHGRYRSVAREIAGLDPVKEAKVSDPSIVFTEASLQRARKALERSSEVRRDDDESIARVRAAQTEALKPSKPPKSSGGGPTTLF